MPLPCTNNANWLDHLRTGVARLDPGLALREVNSGLCELLGAGTALLLGQSLPQLVRLAGGQDLETLVRKAQREGRGISVRGALACSGPGREARLDLQLGPLPDGGMLLEAQPAAPEAAASHLSRSLRGFAHEVKNPLAAISGAAQLLQQRDADPRNRELTGLILSESRRLAALADKLLGSRTSMAARAINVHALLEHVAQLLGAERADVEVIRDYDPSLPALHGDPDRLLQILLNLVRNAIEADARRIVLRSRAETGLRDAAGQALPALRIEVEDDGTGVPEALEATLFEPMVSGRADGSGLGLALAREIAREHDGELVHQRRDGATCFVLILPRRAQMQEAAHG